MLSILDKNPLDLKRLLTYFTGPIFLAFVFQYTESSFVSLFVYSLLAIFYFFYFLNTLGFLLDKRFKIYYRTNSTLDRPLYRCIFGFSFLSLISLPTIFLSDSVKLSILAVIWLISGIHYIFNIRKTDPNSVKLSLQEFRHFDSFEKISAFLIFSVAIFSFPQLAGLKDFESFLMFYDPLNLTSGFLSNFFYFVFNPIYALGGERSSIIVLIYLLFIFLTSSCSYSLMRQFYSRRLALLGTLTFIASWPLVKAIEGDFLYTLVFSSWGVVFIWATYWTMKSSSYRSGLFFGLCSVLGMIINSMTIFIFPIILGLFTYLFHKDSSSWFKRQFIKYNLTGLVVSFILAFFVSLNPVSDHSTLLNEIMYFIKGKDILILFFPGVLFVAFYLLKGRKPDSKNYNNWLSLLIIFLVYALISRYRSTVYVDYSFLLCMIIMTALFPIEWLFKKLYGFRSRRNFIFASYVIICLLDSRLEERIKTFISLINPE